MNSAPAKRRKTAPSNAGDGLPIERLGNRLDDEFISPNLSAQRAAVPRQGLPRERLAYLAKRIRALGEGPLFEILRDLNHLVVAGVNACFRARGRGEAPAMPGGISVMSAPHWRADPQQVGLSRPSSSFAVGGTTARPISKTSSTVWSSDRERGGDHHA